MFRLMFNLSSRHVNRPGFTLIELLIVVAIIAILAAIAVPNFLEAQVRAKVSRAKSDLRTIATALESYAIDNARYPPSNGAVEGLTTPIAYLTSSVFTDPFGRNRASPPYPADIYAYANMSEDNWPPTLGAIYTDQDKVNRTIDLKWLTLSNGPDGDTEVQDPTANYTITPAGLTKFFSGLYTTTTYYDPTNGTVSDGDIVMSQKGFLTYPVP